MKKYFYFFTGLIFIACSNNEDGDVEKTYQEDTWEITVKASESVEHRYLLMENFPIEGGPVITKDAAHASVSEIEHSNGIYYVYKPENGFTGTDKVEITNNISNGAETVAQTIIKLSIEVKE